jgi:glycosyltransferase involved in cell wall biosynthesis
MRILHILNDVGSEGSGIVNTAVDLAIEQARQGHTVAIASIVGDFPDYRALLERSGVDHIAIRNQARRPRQLLPAVFEMRRILADFQPTVVHTHMRAGLVLAWIWSKILTFGLVSHAHNIHERATILMGLADRVIAVSGSVARTLERQGIPKDKLRVVLNRNIGTTRIPPLDQMAGMILRRPSIVTIAGMTHRKGIAELIAAFAIAARTHPDAHLYLVGDGPQRELFEQQARACGAGDRIHFELFASAPVAYLLNTDVFVLASRRDSFPLVLLEARQAGCAILATDVDGIPEALDGGRAGLLVPPNDPAELAQGLCRLLDCPNERASFGREAVVGIEGLNVHSFGAEVDTVYRELLQLPKIRIRHSREALTKVK